MAYTKPLGMRKHVSRRELTRRVEQGRSAMHVLAAVVVQAGGTIRLKRDVYESLPPGHHMTVDREPLTGDLLVRAGVEGRDTTASVGQEMTFAEIQERYGRKPEAEAEKPAESGEGSPDDRVLAKAED